MASIESTARGNNVAKKKKKAVVKDKVMPIDYWIHEGEGKCAISRGEEARKEYKERGFRQVGPQTFKRFAQK